MYENNEFTFTVEYKLSADSIIVKWSKFIKILCISDFTDVQY